MNFTTSQLLIVAGGMLGAVARDLGSYLSDRRKWVTAKDAGAIDLPPKPTFDIPLFIGSIILGAISSLPAIGIGIAVS